MSNTSNSIDTRERIPLVRAKDCDVSYFCGSGAGEQARNKVASGVQIKHIESGAIGRCSESRSQLENKKKAFTNMTQTPKFKLWLSKKLFAIQNGETIEESVDRQMSPENIQTQIKDEQGRWHTVEVSELKDE